MHGSHSPNHTSRPIYVPASLKPTQANLPLALVLPFIKEVQGKGSRAELIATSTSTAHEVIRTLIRFTHQNANTMAQTELDDELIETTHLTKLKISNEATHA